VHLTHAGRLPATARVACAAFDGPRGAGPRFSSTGSRASAWTAAEVVPDGVGPRGRASDDAVKPFRLSSSFVGQYANLVPPFGFNGLGAFVYATRYARALPSGGMEVWWQTVERVVNGTYRMQQRWIAGNELGWDARRAQASARQMFDKIFHMKFLPPGRGLWAMGSPMTEERGLYAALNNCAFVSTSDMRKDAARPFTFLMDAAMLGVGVGFDTDGAGSVVVKGVDLARPPVPFTVPDSREGWVESVRLLLDAHFHSRPLPVFDYSLVRPRGTPIKGFGGTASGPGVLAALHADISASLSPLAGKPITVTAIVDIMNQIGRCIVSGDVRQTAEIAFGQPDSAEYINLKNYKLNPARAAWGWTSNNSVYAPLGMAYEGVAERVRVNGEPGFAWLDNMRAFGRMGDAPNLKDARAKGGNPCLEQTLESYELCCLVETFPASHTSLEDFQETLKYAYLYAKTVTLGRTHWPATNRVLLRNRRIGCSMSGIAQFIAERGTGALKEWCDAGYASVQGYDAAFSDWLVVPRSIKTTSIKPSGTVSLLAGATPGMHYPESRFYLRRVRVGKDNEVVPRLIAAGYAVEPAVEDPSRKVVVTFPVDAAAHVGGALSVRPGGAHAGSAAASPLPASLVPGPGRLRTLDEVSMWEQFALAALLQRHWADNQVSCTITFDPVRDGPDIAKALDIYQYQLKGVSLLPRTPTGQYAQLPYEVVPQAVYEEALARLRLPLDLSGLGAKVATAPDQFCDSDSCQTADVA